jgi:hypothetical protein
MFCAVGRFITGLVMNRRQLTQLQVALRLRRLEEPKIAEVGRRAASLKARQELARQRLEHLFAIVGPRIAANTTSLLTERTTRARASSIDRSDGGYDEAHTALPYLA